MKSAHIGIKVSDLERSIEFYVESLGGNLVRRVSTEKAEIAFIKTGDATLELVEKQEKPHHSDAIHLAFVVDDMETALNDLRSRDVDLGDESPIEFGDGCIFFFNGPDGERIELCQGVGTIN